MLFELTEDQRAFQDMARAFAAEELEPNAAEWDRKAFFPVETLRRAAALGFASIYVKEDVGGAALTRLDAALIFEALSAGCTSTAAFLSIHNMASWMIDTFGSEALRRKYLPRLTTMELIASYCLTEPAPGRMRRRCARARSATATITSSTAPRPSSRAAAPPTFTSAWCAPARRARKAFPASSSRRARRVSPSARRKKKMGWNSQPTAQVIFEDCRVPVANRVGEEGEGFKFAMMGLDGGRLNIAACALGTATSAFNRAKSYMTERQQFGKPLASLQALQFKLADMATELEAARLILYQAATKVEAKAPDATMQAAMAKRFVTDASFHVANEALQIHGGYGYLNDFPLERHVRDLRVHQILEGTNEIMRVIIARELLKS